MKIKNILISSFLVCTFLMSGCGNGQEKVQVKTEYKPDNNLNEPGEFPICKEKIPLRLLIGQNANVSDYKNNSYTKKIEEYGNVDLEFDVVPSADISTKLNLIMNSGVDLPDVIISGLTPALCETYGKSGMLLPLNQYYENSAYYINKALDKVKDKNIMNYLTSADGNIYTVLSYNEFRQNEFSHVLWMYKPWLDELNMEVPKTLDELKTVLQAFKDNDLNHNGKNDEIPMIDYANQNAVNLLMNTFITFEPTADMLSVKDGKLRFAYTTEEWKNGLKYMRELCTNDLFSPVSFSTDQSQLKATLANETNRVGAFVWTTPSAIPATSKRRAEFVPCFIEGENHQMSTIYAPSMPNYYFGITKECKNPEAAFRIGDLLCKEDLSLWSSWGEKGVDWVEPEEGDKALFDFLGYKPTLKAILEVGKVHSSFWGPTLGFKDYEMTGGIVSDDIARRAKADALKTLVNYVPEETVGRIIFDSDELSEYNEIIVNSRNYYLEYTTKFVTGYADIDKEWDNYVNELENNIGLKRALEIAQKAYLRTKGQQ